jgi:hypothetical protein
MTDQPNEPYRDVLVDVMHATANLPDLAQRLRVLSTAWMVVASDARHEQLFEPGGFQAEQRHQLDELERLARIVRQERPDLEFERLLHEGNFNSLLNYLHRRRDELSGDL